MYPLNPRFPYRKPPMLSKVSSPMVGRRLQEQFQDQLERLEASVDDGNFILESYAEFIRCFVRGISSRI